MINNFQLIKLLKILKKEEWKKVKKMAQSPFFTSNHRIEKLLLHLEKFSPTFSSKRLNKKTVFEAVFPSQKFDDKKLRKLFSETLKMTKRFLVINHLEQDESRVELDLLEIYQKRGLINEFALLDKKVEKKYESRKIETPEFLLKKIRFNEGRKILKQAGNKREYQLGILNLKNDLTNYFEIKQAMIQAELFNNETIFKLDNLSVKRTIPVLKTIYLNLKTIRQNYDPRLFNETLEIYEKNLSNFPHPLQYEIFQLFNNSIIGAYNNHLKNKDRAFAFFERAIEKEYIFNNGFISLSNYISIIAIGTRLEKHDWVDNFIINFEEKLKPGVKEKDIFSAKTNYYILRKQYKKALKYTDNNNAKSSHELNYLAKVNQCRIYFELYLQGDISYEFVLNKINGERRWIKRNKNYSSNRTNMFEKFILTIQKILNHHNNVNKKPEVIENLNRKIKNDSTLINKPWLLEKLQEIK